MTPSFSQPDTILLAGRCHAMTRCPAGSDAVALAGERIVALGPRARIKRLAGRGTRVLDLGPATLTPGLVDCHTHFFYWALQRAYSIDVTGLTTLDATLAKIRAEQRRRALGSWVIAGAFNQNAWGRDFPRAADLDRAVPDRPALVRSRDGHSVWLNSAALREAGIGPNTPDPPGGRYLRDTHGRPTGIAQETAIDRLPNPVREFAQRHDPVTLHAIDHALEQAYRAAWAAGLVGVHSMDDAPSLAHFQRQRLAGQLGVRVAHAIPLSNLAHARELGLRSGMGDEWLRLGAVKIFADGALGSQTAYMFDEYPKRPGYHGVPVLVGEELKETVIAATRHGWAVWIHAIGDRAVHDAIVAIAAARRVAHLPLPHRIEHAQCVRPADVRRMARLGIVASVQPCHIPGDIATANRHWPRARRHAYPLRTMLDARVTLAAGSDVPIESIDPRRSFFGAACRIDGAAQPAGGWFPAQRLTTREMLHAFTRGAAASVGRPAPAGTLAPGAPADLSIWRDDPLRAPPQELLEIGIAGCIVGGKIHLTERG